MSSEIPPNTTFATFLNTSVLETGNSSENDTGDDEQSNNNQFILPLWKQLLWTFLYAGMVVVATGGNLIVIWIVLAHKRMRTVTNYFLVNLSIADAMVSTLNVTFNFVYMLNSDWPFGTLYCKISQFVAVLSICASVFTLMAISIDRYKAIIYTLRSRMGWWATLAIAVTNWMVSFIFSVSQLIFLFCYRYMAIIHPLRPRMGRRATLAIAVIIWVVGSIFSVPQLIFFTTFVQEFPNGDHRVICYSEWPDGPTTESFLEYIYNVLFLILTYFLPICSMSFTYVRVGLELWGSQSIGECTQRQMENIKSKRRVVKMMIVVVLIFAVCWLPFHIYFIITSHIPEITNSPYIQDIFLFIYWLAMSNSMYNPIIYCWMNMRFRRGFKQFFSCCPFVHLTPDGLTRREAVTSRYNSCSGSPEAHYRIVRNGAIQPGSTETGLTALGESPSYYHHTAGYRARRRWKNNGTDS